MLKIDFLYYDKTLCKRCIITDKSLELTFKELRDVIRNSKMKVILKKRKLPESKIHLSPTILINGRDIEKLLNKNSKFKSNICSSCCQLVGHPVSCRTFSYKGKNYNYIPKEMILEALSLSIKKKQNK
jgi:hypothetical protein